MEAIQAQNKTPAKEPVFLLAAARYGHLNKIREFIEKQHYPVDCLGEDGYTALHVACENRRVNIIEYLVKAGADVFAKNVEGDTPYSLVKEHEKKNAGSDVYRAIHGTMLILGECKICMEPEVSLYSMPCGDQACVECIQSWFQSLLSENDPLKCPAAECQEANPDDIVPPDHVDAWRLMAREDFIRYDKQMLQRHLVVTKDFQFCTHCESGGYIAHSCSEVICVACDQVWCRDCRLPPHKAFTCEEFVKMHHEENMKCMADNCKKCPQCKAHIERDGGCSHMKCGQCKYEFCWWCLGKYQPGQYTFDEDGECPCDKLNRSGGWA
jgi:hypothetical protein